MVYSREAALNLYIKQEGAKETAESIGKISTSAASVQSELAKISRNDAITQLATKYGIVAKKTKDATAAAEELNKELQKINATESEVSGAASTFSQQAASGNRLARIGSELRSLPSTQVPGLGIGTDQVASILRLGGALGNVSEKVGLVTTVATALTPTLGATAAGIVGISVAAAPFVIAAGAVALALKSLSDQAAKEAEAINAIVDAQRSIAQDIANGLTTEEAEEKLKTLNAERQAEADLLAKNQQVYKENIENQGPLTAVLKATSGAEQALAEQIEKSQGLVEGYDTSINALNQAMDNGTLSANDAAEAEKKLAEERSKTALASADSAAKQLQAEQKALNSTEEQNLKRLDTIEDERAVLEKQIEVLEQSGVTSDEVTTKITALKDQLGLLGKESDFINTTALEASRAADADKKAKKDAEDAAKKAQQAQEQYTKSVQGAQTTFRQSVQDIGTRFTQTLQDNQTKFDRDLTDIATKYRRDEYDLTIKANRAERDALQNQLDDLEDVRKDARKEQLQAIQDGDFKALFLARQKGDEALAQEQTEIDLSRQKREQADRDAREDLLRNAQRQRQDRMLADERQLVDARTAQGRELAQARLTQQRALQAASEALNAELGLRQQFWNATLKQAQNALNQIQGAGAQGGADALRTGPTQAFSFGGLRRVIQR